jgi:hypothetical protein
MRVSAHGLWGFSEFANVGTRRTRVASIERFMLMHGSYAGSVETGSREVRGSQPEIVAESPLSAKTHVVWGSP